jgi:hypothetical protein
MVSREPPCHAEMLRVEAIVLLARSRTMLRPASPISTRSKRQGAGQPSPNGRVDQFYPGLSPPPRQSTAMGSTLILAAAPSRRRHRVAPPGGCRREKFVPTGSWERKMPMPQREVQSFDGARDPLGHALRAVAATPLPAAATAGQPRCRRRCRGERRRPDRVRFSISKPGLGLDAVGSSPYYPRTLRRGAGGRKPPKRSRVIGSWLCAVRDGASIWSSHEAVTAVREARRAAIALDEGCGLDADD